MTLMDPRLRELDPRPARVARPIATAREAVGRATARLLSIPDASLEREWAWIGGGETDVRSGFYIALQALHGAAGSVTAAGAASGHTPTPASAAIAAATAARWELHGVLAPLADEILDADPGGGEWTIRQTLAHTLDVQRAYAWFTAWWVDRRDEPDFPPQAPESLGEGLPEEADHAAGSMTQIRRRLDALVDLSTEVYRDATEDQLRSRARWSGFPVTAGFRLGRWAPHMEEHTVQVEKTLALLGRQPTEVERLVRLIHRGMGGLEAAASGLPSGSLEDGIGAAIVDAAAKLERIAQEIAEVARR